MGRPSGFYTIKECGLLYEDELTNRYHTISEATNDFYAKPETLKGT
jgi:hypothetical protein